MRRLKGSIKTFHLDRVKESLARLGVTRMTISQAELPRASGIDTAAFLPKITVEVFVSDELADQVAEVLADAS